MEKILRFGLGVFNRFYSLLKLLPSKKKILFLSRQSDNASVDIDLLVKEINKTHSDYQTAVLCKKIAPSLSGKLGYLFHMLRQAYHLATSQAVIIDSYAILVSCLNHKSNLLVIQMWHSIGTMKKFGYSILDKPEGSSSALARAMHMHENYDYMLASADSYKPHLAEGFNQDVNRIVTLALPRVELLKSKTYSDETKKKIFAKYPQFQNGKTNIVYCPTFRKQNDEQFAKALEKLAESIDSCRYNLIVKVHPLTDIPAGVNNILTAAEFSTFEMLFVSDMVISDYSCIIYEAAVLNKPIFFYTYDFDEYMSTRDIYMDYEREVPGPVCKTSEELLRALDSPYDMKRLKSFTDKYISPENHDETTSIVDFVFNHLK